MIYSLFRTLHFLSLFVLIGAIVIENMAIKPRINREDAANLARIDGIAGLSALLTLGFGLTLWFLVGKPSAFYSTNPIFHAKLGLFAGLLLLASYPALFFFKNRRSEANEIPVPLLVRRLLKCELLIALIIPFLAFLMARGIGLPG